MTTATLILLILVIMVVSHSGEVPFECINALFSQHGSGVALAAHIEFCAKLFTNSLMYNDLANNGLRDYVNCVQKFTEITAIMCKAQSTN